MKLDTYLSLCSQYYELDKPDAPHDALEFYLKYVKNTDGPILEPMCGTGRFLLPLIEMGLALEGYDASPQMLSILKDKANQKSLKPNVWEQFVEAKTKEQKYGLVFIPSSSLGLLTEEERLNVTLKNFFNTLSPGGKLIFEAETLTSIPSHFNSWQGSLRHKDKTSFIMLSSFHLPLEKNIVTTVCRYELVEDGKITKSETELIKVRLHDPETLAKKLKTIGFSKISLVKSYQHEAQPDPKDEIIVYECEKD